MAIRKHPYSCPKCGREVLATAKYAARQQLPCLGCTREATGWTHQPTCPGPADHSGACTGLEG